MDENWKFSFQACIGHLFFLDFFSFVYVWIWPMLVLISNYGFVAFQNEIFACTPHGESDRSWVGVERIDQANFQQTGRVE